jgi:hypothetical protein
MRASMHLERAADPIPFVSAKASVRALFRPAASAKRLPEGYSVPPMAGGAAADYPSTTDFS